LAPNFARAHSILEAHNPSMAHSCPAILYVVIGSLETHGTRVEYGSLVALETLYNTGSLISFVTIV
jgi:hypothetical protein